MKKHNLVAVALVIAAMAAGSAFGHVGEQKYMFQFPAGLEPTLDGDLSDWDFVPEVYRNRGADLFNQFGAPLDLADFNSLTIWGYSPTTGLAYFGYWVADDHINNTEKWSTTTDWDHSGGLFSNFPDASDEFNARWKGSQAQRYDYSAPVFSSSSYYTRNNHTAWAGVTPYVEWGGQFLKGDVDTHEPAEMQGEISMLPFDEIHPDGLELSTVHVWTEGEIVGLETNWGDKDADPGAYDDAYWSHFGGEGASYNADKFGDVLLAPVEPGLPTAVTSSTWGQIKSSFTME